MSVKNQTAVAQYVADQAAIIAGLENLTEFVETIPAPDEDGYLQNVDYGYTGSLNRIRGLIAEAMQIADAMSK